MTRVAAPVGDVQEHHLRENGLLADDPAGLLAAWDRVGDLWRPTTDLARTLPADVVQGRVGDGWSLVETLRHLVFVTDAWVRRVVLELPDAHHPMGLQPDFVSAEAARELGLDPAADPSLDEVLAVREERAADVRAFLADLPAPALDEERGRFTVLGAVQIVVFEEWAHHRYAVRDLAVLGA